MKRITSEIKKSGWFFCILYLGIIAYIVLSISEGNFKDYYSFKTIIIIFVIVILDFFYRLVKKTGGKTLAPNDTRALANKGCLIIFLLIIIFFGLMPVIYRIFYNGL
jgi:hypothetical protein